MERIFSLVLLGAAAASLCCWVVAISRWRRGGLLPLAPRRPTPWGLVDLAMVVLLLQGLQFAAILLFSGASASELEAGLQELPAEQQAAVILASGVASLAAVAVSASLIAVRTGARTRDFGFDLAKTAADLRLGVAAFVMLAPLVYAIQWSLVQRFESKHPLVELLRQESRPFFVVVSVFAAVVVAPLAEEYFFRVLLQGWLEQAAVYRGPIYRLLLGGEPESPSPITAQAEQAEQAAAGDADAGDSPPHERNEPLLGFGEGRLENPYAPPRTTAMEAATASVGDQASIPLWPILVSAAAFALMHVQHGPDCIPLFGLAVGLGYLYQRTHRVLPCVTVHFLLNSFSLAALLAEVFG